MVAYHCPTQGGHRLPDSTQRAKIERQVAKSVYEHLIVFTDAANETQIWYWVKREPGRPAVARSHTYHRSQRGDALLQKLDAIVVTLEEEEALSQIDVTRRARAAFDVERVTKRFYDRFQKEHTVFLQFITGITDRADHEWYASVMLNRLMFVYFIQCKGFLDDDRDYLRNRLKQVRAEHGREKFYSFYRYFLLRLFHEGLGATQRSAELEKLIGHIPYLDGGIFDVHELERPDRYGKFIQIPDDAFEHVFDYFDQYQWHLDERPLRAFWHATEKVTVLGPTCGSGAFLFAALNILEPLYQACLDRMEAFLEDLERYGKKHHPEKFSDFRKVLAHVAAHPNRCYFIFKTIILTNLYGVDIMEEAVEICKLRLFLKLAAQVDPDTTAKNLGVEPLPDIDFNIRAGNTLVGFTSISQVRDAAENEQERDDSGRRQSRFLLGDANDRISNIEQTAAELQQTFDAFRSRQVEGDSSVPTEDKQELRKRLGALDDELNAILATEYGVEPSKKDAYAKWIRSHQPFHWFVEFYGIMSGGGFDVIIGNPPWKEYSAVKDDYTIRNYCVERSGNLYALCSERSLQLMAAHGYFSFIVQLPLVSSARMVSLRQHLIEQCSYLNLIPCDDRPGKLFDGLQHCRSCIFVARKRRMQEGVEVLTTRYNRWASEVRDTLLKNVEFTHIADAQLFPGQFPKLGAPVHAATFKKIFACNTGPVQGVLAARATARFIFYQEATQYWVKATIGLPFYAKNGNVGAPAHGRYLFFRDVEKAHAVCAVLNSNLFYSYFIAHGDCFHLSEILATGFPLSPPVVGDKLLVKLDEKLMTDLRRHAQMKTIATKSGDEISYDEFNVSESKPIIDDIDCVLARHYGFTEEELDFIINDDIKYRMGLSADQAGREAEDEDE